MTDGLSLWHGQITIRPKGPTMAQITAEVAVRYGITVGQLKGPRGPQSVAVPRQEAMWTMHEVGRFSHAQIGRFLGGRDHSTVVHGVQAHERRAAG